MIGRERTIVSPEERHVLGPPWRRVELLSSRSYHRGRVETSRVLICQLGWRRTGLALTLTLSKQPRLNYTRDLEEER